MLLKLKRMLKYYLKLVLSRIYTDFVSTDATNATKPKNKCSSSWASFTQEIESNN